MQKLLHHFVGFCNLTSSLIPPFDSVIDFIEMRSKQRIQSLLHFQMFVWLCRLSVGNAATPPPPAILTFLRGT